MLQRYYFSWNKKNLIIWVNTFVLHLYSRAFLATKDIYSYDKYKDMYAKPQKRVGFNEGLWEIIHKPDVKFIGKVSMWSLPNDTIEWFQINDSIWHFHWKEMSLVPEFNVLDGQWSISSHTSMLSAWEFYPMCISNKIWMA